MSSSEAESIEDKEKATPQGEVKAVVDAAWSDSEIDPESDRRVRSKIDRTVLVVFCFIYLFQYLDKIALSYAAIFGMRTDLHLVGQDYSWASSAFYFGQLVFEYPAIWLLHKFPIKTFVGVTVVCWGVIMMSMAAANNFAGLVAVRVFLGMAEGAVAPAFVILISFWYKKAEQPLRIACFVSANALAQIVGGLVLYGCGSIKHAAIAGFRISYLIAGGATIVLGIVFVLVVPASPSTAWFLTTEERAIAVRRVAREHASSQHSAFSRSQLFETLKDPKLYLIFLWAFFVCITSVVTFGSIVISGLGFDSFKTILVGLPGPAIQLATIWTRKTIVSFAYFIGYCVGCICGPQLFLTYEKPLYPTAMGTAIGIKHDSSTATSSAPSTGQHLGTHDPAFQAQQGGVGGVGSHNGSTLPAGAGHAGIQDPYNSQGHQGGLAGQQQPMGSQAGIQQPGGLSQGGLQGGQQGGLQSQQGGMGHAHGVQHEPTAHGAHHHHAAGGAAAGGATGGAAGLMQSLKHDEQRIKADMAEYILLISLYQKAEHTEAERRLEAAKAELKAAKVNEKETKKL
ncbi:hypothetical protein RQP46_003781 [Phenoliferia psychrophenolica]